MTGGTVLILGPALANMGSGMTGGVLYTLKSNTTFINYDYLKEAPITVEDSQSIELYLSKFETAVGRKYHFSVNQLAKFVPIEIDEP